MKHTVPMSTLTIRDLPEDVIRELAARADRAGQPLEACARAVLIREISGPALADVVEAVRRTALADVAVSDVLSAVDAGRAGR